MDASLLDTDILNEVLKQRNANVVRHAAEYLAAYGKFSISGITRYDCSADLRKRRLRLNF